MGYRYIAIENSASEKDKIQQRDEALQAIRVMFTKTVLKDFGLIICLRSLYVPLEFVSSHMIPYYKFPAIKKTQLMDAF